MTGLKLNREVNVWSVLTTVIAAVGMLITVGMWSSRLESRMDRADAAIVRLETADVKLGAQVDAARDLATGRQETIINRLARIEAILDRVEKRAP